MPEAKLLSAEQVLLTTLVASGLDWKESYEGEAYQVSSVVAVHYGEAVQKTRLKLGEGLTGYAATVVVTYVSAMALTRTPSGPRSAAR